MVTHSSILAWEIPWTEEPEAIVYGVAESDTTEQYGTNMILSNSNSNTCHF